MALRALLQRALAARVQAAPQTQEEPATLEEPATPEQRAAPQALRERPVAAVIEEFATGRDEGIALVTALRPSDLDRHAVHAAVGRVTVRELLQEWVFHDRNHIRQLLANAQARAWPRMGNTQRFTRPAG